MKTALLTCKTYRIVKRKYVPFLSHYYALCNVTVTKQFTTLLGRL